MLAYNDHMDIGVVYGYEQGGAVLWYSDYRPDVGMPYRVPADKIGPLQAHYIGRKDPALPPIERLEESLRQAVLNWGRGVHDGGIPGRAYHYGSAALRPVDRDPQAGGVATGEAADAGPDTWPPDHLLLAD